MQPENELEFRVFAHSFAYKLRPLSAVVFSLALAICALMATQAPAHAAATRAYAGIVVDAKSGKALYESAADAARYPASLTKVMTLYILFQELEAGNLTLKSKMTVSKHAANAVPTKLGLRAGSTIAVEDAIKSLVTLSANDMARVIAEHISGTESKFGERMTRTARALGMNRTTYRNASGLPDSGQVTTARDQARLAAAIYQHFPKYYEYFQTRSFKYGGRTYGNHNRLLGQNGVDGIKTGYIRASGYNLMTAARKNDRHIVVVALGFDTGSKRNAKVASLVSSYMPKARKGVYLAQATIARPGGAGARIQVAAVPVTPMPRLASRMPLPDAPAPFAPPPPVTLALAQEPPAALVPAPQERPVELVPATAVAATTVMAQPAGAPEPIDRPIDIVGAWIEKNLRLGPEINAQGAIVPPAAIESAPAQTAGNTLDLLTSGASDAQPVDSWVVQVGAAPTEQGAQSLLVDAQKKMGELQNFRSFIETFSKNGQTFHRARFAGFGGQEHARDVCAQLQKKNMGCLAMQG